MLVSSSLPPDLLAIHVDISFKSYASNNICIDNFLKNVSVKLYINNSCVKLMIDIIDSDLRADELTKMWELF